MLPPWLYKATSVGTMAYALHLLMKDEATLQAEHEEWRARKKELQLGQDLHFRQAAAQKYEDISDEQLERDITALQAQRMQPRTSQ